MGKLIGGAWLAQRYGLRLALALTTQNEIGTRPAWGAFEANA